MITNQKNITAILFCLFFLSGCFGLFDSGSQRIIGRYEVLWIDLPQNQALTKVDKEHSSSSATLIEPYIFAVGHNDSYIIVKQHPTGGFEKNYEIHTDTTNYYIIDIANDRDEIYGPLSLPKFDSLRLTLKITAIQFDKTYLDKY